MLQGCDEILFGPNGGDDSSSCVYLNPHKPTRFDDPANFPPVELSFGTGLTITLPPESYLQLVPVLGGDPGISQLNTYLVGEFQDAFQGPAARVLCHRFETSADTDATQGTVSSVHTQSKFQSTVACAWRILLLCESFFACGTLSYVGIGSWRDRAFLLPL